MKIKYIILCFIILISTYAQDKSEIKSINNDYKKIEKSLKNKIQDLNSLYRQGDYIVKPEYLEWQVYFSMLYNNYKIGNNSDDKSGENDVIPVPINLGILIPMRKNDPIIPYINVDTYSYNFLTPPQIDIGEVELLLINPVDAVDFIIMIPNIQHPTAFDPVQSIPENVSTNSNGYTAGANNQNLNTNSQTPSPVLASSNSQSGLMQIIGVEGTNYIDLLGGTGNLTYVISSDLENQKRGARIIATESHRGFAGVTGVTSATGDADETLFITTTGTLTISADDSIGVEMERGYGNFRNDSVYVNKGTIFSTGDNAIGVDLKGEGIKGPILTQNDGTIRMNGDSNIGMNSVRTPGSTGRDLDVGIRNTGLIEMNGNNSTGIFIGGKDLRGNCYQNAGCPVRPVNLTSDVFYSNILEQSGTINVNGEKSMGVVLTDTDGLFNVLIPTDAVLNESTGVININGKNSVGLYANGSYSNSGVLYGEETNYYNNGIININSEDTMGIRVDYSGVENTGTITLTTSAINSLGMGGGNSLVNPKNSGKIELLSGGSQNIGMFVRDGRADNLATGQILVDGLNATGILVVGGTGENNGLINVYGGNSLGIAVDGGSFDINGGTLLVGINNSNVGVYGIDNSLINLNSGVLNTEAGIALYINSNTIVNIKSQMNISVGSQGLFLYAFDAPNTYSGKINTDEISNVSIGTNGYGFYYGGNAGAGVETFLRNTVIGTGTLNFNMDVRSVLVLLDVGIGTQQYLTDLALNESNIGNVMKINGSNYYNYGVSKGNLVMNTNANLDNDNDPYLKSLFLSSSIDINPGVTISGTRDNQDFIVQENYSGTPGRNEITINNNGTVNLTGVNSYGIVVDFGVINNNAGGIISTTGDGGKALAGINGSLVNNAGSIILNGMDSVGMYGVNQNPFNPASYGDKKIELYNDGSIESLNNAEKVYGIYALNTMVPRSDSTVTLTGNSNIDFQNSSNAVGVFAVNSTLNGSGTITVGTKGIGIYARNSNVDLSNFTMNLTGDSSLGFYLFGDTDFTATSGVNTINIYGQNNSLYYIQDRTSSVFNQNFDINVAPGASYLLGFLDNTNYTYNGIATLEQSGIFVYGKGSRITLGSSSEINSSGINVMGVFVDGIYSALGREVVNHGSIKLLGNFSTGIFAENNARVLNDVDGLVQVGNESVGIYAMNSGAIENLGEILIGSRSAGIYSDSNTFLNNYGIISSQVSDSVGMYSKVSIGILNDTNGLINLSGDNSIGLYNLSGANLENKGTIIIGDSVSQTDPGMGIYSSGNINNTGIINTGVNSVGIYGYNGVLLQDGSISTGNNSIGIYADQETVTISALSTINVGDTSTGVYGKNGTDIVNNGNMNIGTKSYGYILNSNSKLLNNSAIQLSDDSVAFYSDAALSIINSSGANLSMSGSNNIGFYMINGGSLENNADISGDLGLSNIGMHNNGGTIKNTGDIKLGDSVLLYKNDGEINYNTSKFSIGIYGENNTSFENTGNIELGADSVGIYIKDYKGSAAAKNSGNITVNKNGGIGLFAENSVLENSGVITMNGDNAIGMGANINATIINEGTITMNGSDSVAMSMSTNSKGINNGTINLNGNRGIGGLYSGNSGFQNNGTININTPSSNLSDKSELSQNGDKNIVIPSIINSGVINVNENFSNIGTRISIKVNPGSVQKPTLPEDSDVEFVSDSVKFNAPYFEVDKDNPIIITADFSQTTNALTYKLKSVFNPMTPNGGPNSGIVSVKSASLTWRAIPVVNNKGTVDIWMEKIPYKEFTAGKWYEQFGNALDSKYSGASGDALKIFDKIDMIETNEQFDRIIPGLAGNMYANMNKREENIADMFGDALDILKNSENNTKENIKVNIIGGKGKIEEKTPGVLGYDYSTVGAVIFREVERTYQNKYGYSFGYTHTNFDFDDSSESEEDVDSLRAGFYNSYEINDWKLRNDLAGMVSFHDTDRNIDWVDGRSNMNGTYQTYSIISDNDLSKELPLTKNITFTPYGGIKVMYIMRPSFSEDGLEALEVEGGNAWSVKPRIGMELKMSAPLGKSVDSWTLNTSLNISYDYELAGLNERERAKVTAIEDDYHNLAKPEDEKGTFKTRGIIGLEIKDRYGIFLTGEYGIGDNSQEEYKTGIMLKAVF